ncbi:hypothetical protein Mapa_008489 [Marchantia paleacea]|nr:hypothetical protein Mapa_008489 [Marchantia paleacea]
MWFSSKLYNFHTRLQNSYMYDLMGLPILLLFYFLLWHVPIMWISSKLYNFHTRLQNSYM